MKIIIAVKENKGLNSKLSEHFGFCPYFAVYDSDTKRLQMIKNTLDHKNQNLLPAEQILSLKPDIIFSRGMGKKALNVFNKKRIKVKTGPYKNLKGVLKNIKNLKNLEEDCES